MLAPAHEKVIVEWCKLALSSATPVHHLKHRTKVKGLTGRLPLISWLCWFMQQHLANFSTCKHGWRTSTVVLLLLSFCAVPELRLKGQSHCWLICTLGMCQSIAPEAISIFSHLGTWCVLHSSTSVHIHCLLSIVLFLIVSCLVVSSACVCVCLETPYCPCSVYNLQVGQTNFLVSFPHLQVSSLVSPA